MSALRGAAYTSSPTHAPVMIAPACADARATSTARAAMSGSTGRAPVRSRIRERSAVPPIASAAPSTANGRPAASGKDGSDP